MFVRRTSSCHFLKYDVKLKFTRMHSVLTEVFCSRTHCWWMPQFFSEHGAKWQVSGPKKILLHIAIFSVLDKRGHWGKYCQFQLSCPCANVPAFRRHWDLAYRILAHFWSWFWPPGIWLTMLEFYSAEFLPLQVRAKLKVRCNSWIFYEDESEKGRYRGGSSAKH
jgi:hypothetical protein